MDREPDNWCHHCEQDVYLTQGRHFCDVVEAYLFGIELAPPHQRHNEDHDASTETT